VRIKVDENIGRSGVEILRQDSHDVVTVREQGLAGAADEVVFQACVAEGRTLITMDRVSARFRVSRPLKPRALSFWSWVARPRCVCFMIACTISSHSPRPVRSKVSFGSSSPVV
jgi:hypothetical protein